MRAIQITRYGDAVEGLELRELDEPAAPGPGEVLVGVEYAPININDLMVVWGIYQWKPDPPETIGNEGMGRILALGDGVRHLAVGEHVVLPFMVKSWRERLVVRADELVALPPDADLPQASMLAINGVTAKLLLDDYVALKEGDVVAFNIATSGIAQWIIALAARKGIRTIGLVRRSEDVARIRASGCDFVVADDEEISSVKQLFSDERVRLALDCVGGPSTARLIHLLGQDGKLVTYGNVSRTPMEVPAGPIIFKNLGVSGFFEGLPHNHSRVVAAMRDLVGLIGPNGVRQPIAATYPMSRIKEAVAHAVRGGRIVLDIGGAAGR